MVEDIDHVQLARDMYGAYVSGDREIVEEILSDDFEFFSPADVGIGRDLYFERC
jgi:ketosteroid isomerase-like protein